MSKNILWLFEQVHGEMTGACSTQIEYDDDGYTPIAVHCIKDGNSCWSASKLDLVFDYICMKGMPE